MPMCAGIDNIMENKTDNHKPAILAPAGDEESFLAAVAAGADCVYLGLKQFSARMEAENFTIPRLARLTELALRHNCHVAVAMNTLVKPDELAEAGRIVGELAGNTAVSGLIVQDLAMLEIARQAAFHGSITLSTLANVANPQSLAAAALPGVTRVVVPRELSIDEIRLMAENCPDSLKLECFVQGALCYCVSGRCYWSSYMGGKSGLRGRCVQPCRRLYSKANPRLKVAKAGAERNFSCQDFQLGEIVKILLSIPELDTWKIEGRKKGPHYVYHTVTAYRLLRDYPNDAQKRKMAMGILDMALGRPGVKGLFLPQRQFAPMAPGKQTSSGLLAGHIRIQPNGSCILKPHLDLLPGDYLRIGVQDEIWHATLPVTRLVPKGGTLYIRQPKHKTPKSGTPVYLVDRRDPDLLKLLAELKRELDSLPEHPLKKSSFNPRLPAGMAPRRLPDMLLAPHGIKSAPKNRGCLGRGFLAAQWLTGRSAQMPRHLMAKTVFWLPPVIWPDAARDYAQTIGQLVGAGARQFVCNAPWQIHFFNDFARRDLDLIAGPFCNITNALALDVLRKMGFTSAIASPEMAEKDILELPRHAPMSLGLVIGGHWPVGISRFGLSGLEDGEIFFSPKGEAFWAITRDGLTWLYPAWPMDLCVKSRQIREAGYSFFVWLEEKEPGNLPKNDRRGLFNWKGELL